GDWAIAQLRDALHLAKTLGLPGEEWPILCALALALAGGGDHETAEAMIRDATGIVQRLAATIDDDDAVRQRFIDGAGSQTVISVA
ncbi:MAG: hypothetical protein HKN93_01650, partial [Acidimicrobiia bacterium]|nr:hypothetical protein [Acidimicrobiia bacterium]